MTLIPDWRRMRQLVATLPDSEHEMATNRVLFGTASAVYVGWNHYPPAGLAFAGLYLLLAFAILGDILVRRRSSVARRCLAIVADMSIISLGMHMGGEEGSLFYPLYLWCAFGNGFRFGTSFLLIATACAVVDFALVVATTPFWQSVPILCAGLMATLVLLPAYASVLIRKLSRANAAAKAASDAKGMFLAGISHEFRTPLNAILGSVALLDDTPLDREQRELAAALDSSTRRLLGLIDSLLDFSRLDAGRMPIEPAPFALAPLLAEIATLLRPRARIKQLRLGVHLDADVPAHVLLDRRRLQEVLINLAGNAMKFTETGSVLIRVSRDASAGAPDRLRFIVSDTGIGIAASAKALIFESFAQADRTILDRFGGTGLGLAICRQLVQLMGGEIGVDSRLGRGSRFWFTLDAPAVPAPVAAPADDADTTPRGFVLVIEDPVIRTRAAAEAAAFGPVRIAAGIEAAIPLLRSGDQDGILLIQGSEATLSAANDTLSRCDPVRDIPCILIGETLPADENPLAIVTDTTVPPTLPDGALQAGIARIVALHPGRDRTGWIPESVPGTSSLLILVADDNALNRQVLSKILERIGHRSVLVSDGDQALDALSRQAFDLVLMDVNMPVLSGLDATRIHRLAEIDGTRLPIVALTADPTDEMRARCLEAGMDQCLSKPIAPKALKQMLDGLSAGSSTTSLPQEVAMLADHPRFRSVLPVLDDAVLDELSSLGGADFVSELLTGFAADARTLVTLAAEAACNDDMPEFRNQLHALRSISANIGARALHQAAGTGRTITSSDLKHQGLALARQLGSELDRFDTLLLSEPHPRRAP